MDALEDKVADIEERIKNIEEFTEWFKRSVDMESLVVDAALWEYERIQQAQAVVAPIPVTG